MEKHHELIIIGAGAAGLVAALQAKEEGIHPIILEKMPEPRGNTKGASAGMNAAETRFQNEQNIEDSVEAFYQETLAGGKNKNDEALLRHFVEQSADAIEWLAEKGILLDNLTQVGGMKTKRTHRPTDGSPIGAYLMKGLLEKVKEEKIEVWTEAEAMELLQENNQVSGVKVRKERKVIELHAKAVIFTTGGFGANRQKVAQHAPQFQELKTTNYPSAQGDGLDILEKAGAQLINLSAIQVHPTVSYKKNFLITEAVRGEGAILLNHSGRRFCNELDTRDVVSAAIHRLLEHSAFLFFDQALRERVPAINFYASQGLVIEADSIGELAQKVGIPRDECVKTIIKWNAQVEKAEKDPFGRNTEEAQPLIQPPYQLIQVEPGVHHTMGGVKINSKTEVLKEGGSPVKGCYAAGEVAGGLHGDNRIGGNAIAETIVFGRQAGKHAARYVNQYGVYNR